MRDPEDLKKVFEYAREQENPVLNPFPGEIIDRAIVAVYLKYDLNSYLDYAADTPFESLPSEVDSIGMTKVRFTEYLTLKCKIHHAAKEECNEFLLLSRKPGVRNAVETPYFAKPVTSEDVRDYVRLGVLLRSLLQTFPVAGGGESLNSPTLTFDPLLQELGGDAGINYFQWRLENRSNPVPLQAERIAKAEGLLRAGRARAAELRQWMRSEHIGWYTTEQEADELALEFLTSVGIRPATFIDFTLSLMDEDEENPPTPYEAQGFSAKECRAMYAAQFNLVDSSRQRVMLDSQVDWIDNHHNLCYRAFNMLREIKTHGWTARTDAQIPLTGGSWSDLQRQMP